MNGNTIYLFLFILAFTIIAAAIGYGYYRFVLLKYTRERFAFFSVRSLIGFIISAMIILLAQNELINFIIDIINYSFTKDIPDYHTEEPWISALLILGCTAFLYLLIRTIFLNWGGEKSVRQNGLEITKRKSSILSDIGYYREITRGQQTIEIYKENSEKKRNIFAKEHKDTRPWHSKAIDLLKLYDRQYYIDKNKNWHRDYDLYLGTYGEAGSNMGVLCLHENPSDNILSRYKDFVNKQTGDFIFHIIIIKGEGVRKNVSHHGMNFEYRYENELLESLIDFTNYHRFIETEFCENKMHGSDLTLSDIYVPLNGKIKTIVNNKLQDRESIGNAEEYIINWVNENQNNKKEQLAILGNYGQGKTVLTHKVVREILKQRKPSQRIPILIELRGLSPRNMDAINILSQWTTRFGGEVKALWELHLAGKLLIILDGFDEMDLVGDTEILFNHFSRLWTLAATAKSKVIIAGRPNLFADDEERREALGIVESRIDLPYTKALFLNPLTKKQINTVLESMHTKTEEGILNALNVSGLESSFGELITRPSTLYQLCTVWDDELAKYKDRLNSAIVIGSFLDKNYDRQGRNDATALTVQERNYFLIGIAVKMMLHNEYSNTIKDSDLRNIIQKLWDNYPPKLPPYKDSQQGDTSRTFLPNRLKDSQNALETIIRDVRTGGVLVQDLSGRDTFKFAHKSYLEYLVSVFYTGFILQNEYNKTQLMIVNSIAETFNFKQSQLVSSLDVERFIAEHIISKIELKDKEGRIMPRKGNEKEYKKAIFKKVIPTWYGRVFPNLTGWMSLHPTQKHLSLIIVLAVCSLVAVFKIDNDILLERLSWFNLFLFLQVIFIVIRYKLYLNDKSIEKIIMPHSKHGTYIRLYMHCCTLLQQNFYPLNYEYFALIYRVNTNNAIYPFITINMLKFKFFVSTLIITITATILILNLEDNFSIEEGIIGALGVFLIGLLIMIKETVALFIRLMDTTGKLRTNTLEGASTTSSIAVAVPLTMIICGISGGGFLGVFSGITLVSILVGSYLYFFSIKLIDNKERFLHEEFLRDIDF